MVRNYVKKTSHERPNEEILKKAVGDVLRGVMTIRKAAQQYGLTKTTVGRYSKLHHGCGILAPQRVTAPAKTILSEEMEIELCSYLKRCALLNHGITTIQTRQLAYIFALANEVSIPSNWKKNEKASHDWLYAFMKRNATLSIRKPEPTSQARAAAFNKPVVMSFYDKLLRVKVKYSFKPYQVWNLDETSNTTVEAPPNVIAAKGTKQVC